MNRIKHFARKQRQANHKKKITKKFILAFLAIFGTQQLSAQQLYFAPPIADPYGLFHHYTQYNSSTQSYEQQFYTDFIDLDDDGDLDLLFFQNKQEYVYPDYLETYQYYFQENTIDVNGFFGDTSIVDFKYNGDFVLRPWEKERYIDLDGDGDLDLYSIMPYYMGHSNSYKFNSFKNNSEFLQAFHFTNINPEFSVTLCSDPYEYYCFQYFDIGDIDNDSYDDLLIYSQQNYGENIKDASFLFYKNNGTVELFPFEAAIENPFNLEAMLAYLLADSANIIFDITIADLDNSNTSELIIQYYNHSLQKLLLESFFMDTISQSFDSGNSQILLEFDSLTLSNLYYHYLLKSFKFVDLDNDGDVDIYSIFTYNDYEPYSSTQNIKYYENRTIVTNINNALTPSISVFPNPMKSSSTIQFTNAKNDLAQIKIYNSIGKLVQEHITFDDKLNVTKDDLSSGFYIIEININGIIGSKKLIVK